MKADEKMKLNTAVKEVAAAKWTDKRQIEIDSFGHHADWRR
ncbi:MAG: hypothetical protein QWI73_06850 [Alphaproteobacteria bacterium]|nr:hypothetical protein [Alphaproteobacteria bacterium]MDN5249785.1 hypothetical protein [Alphaproteobacteria bacterium]